MNGGSDSRPPSFRPTAVSILHFPPGYIVSVLDSKKAACSMNRRLFIGFY